MTIVPDGGVARLRVNGVPSHDKPGESDPLVCLLNDASPDDCTALLSRCCGSRRWAESMTMARPFASQAALFGEAETLWWALGDGDWLEAFTHHPQIGADVDGAKSCWGDRSVVGGEQASVHQASETVLTELLRRIVHIKNASGLFLSFAPREACR